MSNPTNQRRCTFAALAICVFLAAPVGLAGNGSTIKFPSPNGRFALRLAAPKEENSNEWKVDLIEKATGNVMLDLFIASEGHLPDTVLVWSADSKQVAYATRDNREGETIVFIWNGSKFDGVPLPEKLPDPKINFSKAAKGGGLKNYGGGTKPVRWLKSGDLELATDTMMMSHVDERSYTGTVKFTVTFDAKHHATLHTVGKSTTKVD
jgi:hypothetical protein